MADYLVEYASVMGLPVRTATTARHVTRSPEDTNAWLVETDDTIIATDSVVIATGGYQLPKVPRFPSELDPGIHQIHSHDYRNPAQFQTGGVLVVGAGVAGADDEDAAGLELRRVAVVVRVNLMDTGIEFGGKARHLRKLVAPSRDDDAIRCNNCVVGLNKPGVGVFWRPGNMPRRCRRAYRQPHDRCILNQ